MNSPYRDPIAETVKLAATSLIAALLLAAPVAAQTVATQTGDAVPIPHLRPSTAAAAAPASTGAGAAAAAVARPNANVPFDPSLPFSAAQQQALANIDAYMNSFSLMEGKFIQVSPSGDQTDGIFFISRPGKLRFHYNPPSQLDIIASNGKVAVRDQKVGTQDEYPLSKTPLRHLLADHIDLLQPGLVGDVQLGNGLIQVTIVEKSALASGAITLTFDAATDALQRWVVTDSQGGQTSFGIYDAVFGKPQNPQLFWIVD